MKLITIDDRNLQKFQYLQSQRPEVFIGAVVHLRYQTPARGEWTETKREAMTTVETINFVGEGDREFVTPGGIRARLPEIVGETQHPASEVWAIIAISVDPRAA